ncbi:MAG: hypothetical protein A2X48_01375 [Lentisphaerae bacterium GWF2_49_21]|nr:MAG: hypothetical protein A2X48_01375 [Lentisphaerae bacterium GWF2_49_21]
MKRIICILAMMMCLVDQTAFSAEKASTSGAEPGKWTMDLDAAKKVAAEKKIPILLNFTGSDWCGWCIMMGEKVFSEKEWQDYATKNLILVMIDFPQNKELVPENLRTRNSQLKESFAVEGFPTYILLDDDGTTMLGKLAAEENAAPKSFIRQIEGVCEMRKVVIDRLTKEMPQEMGRKLLAKVGEMRETESHLQKATMEYEKLCKKLEDAISADRSEINTILEDWKLSKLAPDMIKAYKEKKVRMEELSKEIEAFIASRPEESEENMARFVKLHRQISELKQEMFDVLSGK